MIDKKLTIVAFGAHPDDCEYSMCGTLIKYVKLGCDVKIIIAMNGRRGGRNPGEELAARRRKEALASAAHIGIIPEFWDFDDGRLVYDRNSYEKVLEVYSRLKPDIIFTHHPDDYHADHRTLSRLVTDSSWVPVFYADTEAGINFNPQFFVDITEQFEMKKKMLMEHASQLEYQQPCKDIDNSMTAIMEIQNRFRGMQCDSGRVKYAEAFMLYPHSRSANAYKLLP